VNGCEASRSDHHELGYLVFGVVESFLARWIGKIGKKWKSKERISGERWVVYVEGRRAFLTVEAPHSPPAREHCGPTVKRALLILLWMATLP